MRSALIRDRHPLDGAAQFLPLNGVVHVSAARLPKIFRRTKLRDTVMKPPITGLVYAHFKVQQSNTVFFLQLIIKDKSVVADIHKTLASC